MTEPVLALDIGGTKFAAAVMAAVGTRVYAAQRPTRAFDDSGPRHADALAADLDDLVREVVRAGKETGELPAAPHVAVSSAGPLWPARGTVSPVNIPGWRDYPLLTMLEHSLAGVGAAPASMRLIGDGHCVALGEWWLGAGRGEPGLIGCIVSTGTGAGVVMHGRPYEGPSGSAVHVGHTSVNAFGPACVCGSRGCVESYASGPAMVRRARERGWAGDDARALADDARGGDATALAVIDEGMQALGAALAGLVTLFDIPVVVVGGGVSKAGAVVLEPLERWFHSFAAMPHIRDLAQLRAASLDNPSLAGAARIALDAADGRKGSPADALVF